MNIFDLFLMLVSSGNYVQKNAASKIFLNKIETLVPKTENPRSAFTFASERQAILSEKAKFSVDLPDDVLLLNLSPMNLTLGSHLQGANLVTHSHNELWCRFHGLHSRLTFEDGNPKTRFKTLLSGNGYTDGHLENPSFFKHPDILRTAFYLPAYYLALAFHASSKLPEILGVCLFESVRDEFNSDNLNGFATCKQNAYEAGLTLLEPAVYDYLEASDASVRTNLITRVRRAVETCIHLHQSQLQDLNQFHLFSSPRSRFHHLISTKSKYAIGYHQRAKLNEGNLDTLLSGDSDAFISHLAKSRWVVPGEPDKSILTNRLIQFGGPMFRIFSDSEVSVIRDWIRSLPDDSGSDTDIKTAYSLPDVNINVVSHTIETRERYSLREAYFRLVNIEQFPEFVHIAKAFVDEWLARNKSDLDDSIPLWDSSYSTHAIQEWFDNKTQLQLNSYVPAPITKLKEDVIEETIQLCPMISIDGGWLQYWSDARLQESPIGRIMYKTLSDEIGNGVVEWHHANLFRKLLESMDVFVPEFASKEFAYYERFDDESFMIPVFWMAISLSPSQYLPETLGLNLAMELSGVGGAYRQARDELKHYGFSSLFVDLHNTIDNASSGHSAMALDAIKIYMENIELQGRDVESEWKRIQLGYRSLRPPKITMLTRFKRSQIQFL